MTFILKKKAIAAARMYVNTLMPNIYVAAYGEICHASIDIKLKLKMNIQHAPVVLPSSLMAFQLRFLLVSLHPIRHH